LKEKILLIFSMKDRSSVPRQEYIKDADKNTRRLHFYAGILLEGVISYDSNILTGGLEPVTLESELLPNTARTELPFIFVLFPRLTEKSLKRSILPKPFFQPV
jgi:hypothetical protein